MSYIDKYNLSSGIKSLVLIGSGAVDKGQSMTNEYPYKKINIPILDIYGEFDFNLVIKEANDRYKNIKTISSLSEQYEIKSSSHYHEDGSDRIIEIVKKWLSDK
jgi:pimeloyl-ACP methyl ester carboxylesterase